MSNAKKLHVISMNDLNRAYYGKNITPTDILVHRAVANPQAAGLIETVAKGAGGSMTVQRTPSSSGQ